MSGLRLSLRLSLTGGASSFDPATLFAANEGGFWDVSDLSSMRQGDTVATAAAAVDSPVGYVADKSGNGRHLTQVTPGLRPILRQTGALYYLEFDGVDDFLIVAWASQAQPWSRISSLRQITWTNNEYIYDGGSSSGAVSLVQFGATPELIIYASGGTTTKTTGATVGTDVVVSEFFSGASSTITVNNGTAGTGDPGATGGNGLTVGSTWNAVAHSNFRWYGAAHINRTLTAGETTDLRGFMATKAGVTL